MATEIPPNKPTDSANSANTVQNPKNAENWITIVASRAIKESTLTHNVSIAILTLLRSRSDRNKWLSTVTAGSEFKEADLSESFKTKLGLKMLALAEKTVHTANKERANILADIVRYYDLNQNEINSISRQLENTDRTDLSSYRTVTGRQKFLRTVEDFDTLPRLKEATKQIAHIVGDEWADKTDGVKTTLTNWYNGEKVTQDEFIEAINQFSHATKLRLIAAGKEELTLAGIVADTDQTTKALFVGESREMLRKEIMVSQWNLLTAESMSDEEITEVVKSLEWSDIKDTRLSAAETLQILEADVPESIPKKDLGELMGDLQQKFAKNAPESKTIREAQGTGRIRNVSAEQEQREKYEAATKFDAEAISKITRQYKDSGKEFIGGNSLLDTEFSMGRKSLIIKNIQADGSEEYIRVVANRDGLSSEQKMPMNLKATLFGYRSSVDSSQVKFGNTRNTTIFTDSFAGNDASSRISTEILSESAFLASLKNEWPWVDQEYERVIAQAQISEVDLDKRLSNIWEAGASLSETVKSSVTRTNSGGTGGNQPPNNSGGGIWTNEFDPLNPDWEETDLLNSTNSSQNALFDPDAGSLETDDTPEEALPNNKSDFSRRIGALKSGANIPVEVGNYLLLWKLGTVWFNIFKIFKSDPELGLQFIDGLGNLEPAEWEFYNYADLFENLFNKRGVVAEFSDSPLESPTDLLGFMQSKSKSDVWKDLKIHKNDDGTEFFDFADRTFDKNKVDKKYFAAPDGRILEMHAIENGQIIARLGKDFKQSDTPGEASTATWYEEPRVYSIQFIAGYLLRSGAVPWNKPDREIESREVKDPTKPGTIRGIMGKLSFHDIMSGGKKFIEEFKHHLEHGNHLQEQRVMLAMAAKTGMKKWNPEWFYDFKSKYELEEKKLIEERVDKLSKMKTDERHKSIRNSLLTDGTHDYDHWTNAIAMIKKHGNLYAGELQDLEGSWIFFKRIASIPLKADVNDSEEFQRIIKSIRGKGIDNITEEMVIEEYMKTDEHFPNSQIWKMVKTNMKAGTDEEMENGGKEAEAFLNIDQRLNYAMKKLQTKEYAHAIGAFKKVLEKPGDASKKQAFAFTLAMSRIPERLPQYVLDEFVKLYDAWRIHSPALAFIKDRNSQTLYRDAVYGLMELKAEKLRSSGDIGDENRAKEINKSVAELKVQIGLNQDIRTKQHDTRGSDFDTKTYTTIYNFWKTNGSFLQKELTANVQWNQFMISASTRKKKPRLDEYYEKMQKQLGDSEVMKSDELDNGTPFMEWETGASILMFKPAKYLDKIGLLNSTGRIETDTLYSWLQKDMLWALDQMRGEWSPMNKEDQREYFTLLYTAFSEKMKNVSDIKSWMDTPLGKDFKSIGLIPPPALGRSQYVARGTKLTEQLNTITAELNPKKIQYNSLLRSGWTPDPILSNQLNTTINKLSAQVQSINSKLTDMKRDYQIRAGEFKPSDPDHIKHFDECFTRFYSNLSVSGTIKNTKNAAANTLTNNWESGEGPTPTGIDNFATLWV